MSMLFCLSTLETQALALFVLGKLQLGDSVSLYLSMLLGREQEDVASILFKIVFNLKSQALLVLRGRLLHGRGKVLSMFSQLLSRSVSFTEQCQVGTPVRGQLGAGSGVTSASAVSGCTRMFLHSLFSCPLTRCTCLLAFSLKVCTTYKIAKPIK